MRSLPIPQLYRSLHLYLMQRIPDDCDSRLTNLIYLMMGLFQSRSVQLHLVARKTPIRAKKLSIVKRFERFLRTRPSEYGRGITPSHTCCCSRQPRQVTFI